MTEYKRGFGMAGKTTIILLLSLIALGTNSGVDIERTDLPVRVRVVRNIGDRWDAFKSAVFWFTVGRFSEEEEVVEQRFSAPINKEWVDVNDVPDGLIEAPIVDETFGDEFPTSMVIPRGEWQQWITSNQAAGFSLTLYNDKINFQAPEHSCVCNAIETAIRVVRNRQLGLQHSIKFSPMSLYGAYNNRWGGSSVYGMLQKASDTGIMPEDLPEQIAIFGEQVCHQNTPYFNASKLPPGWEETGKHFRPLKFFRIYTKEQFATALLRGWPVVNGRSGHSICHLELVVNDGRFLSKYADSYGTGRGDNGYLYDSESRWATGGAWCLVSVVCPDDPKFPAGNTTYLKVQHESLEEFFVICRLRGDVLRLREHGLERSVSREAA